MRTNGNLSSSSRGLIILFILLLLAVLSLGMLFPIKITPDSASLDVYSAVRAFSHLLLIAKEPHPQGSPAQERVRNYIIQQLTGFGLDTQIQEFWGVSNVIARIRGSNPTGAVVVLAHYDTIATSPGAGDNGSAVAALIEIARVLSVGPDLQNDIIVLFDDGEELPDAFAGTKAFVYNHPWIDDVRVAISLDTAVAGPISTNEVGPRNNGWLVQALARAYTGGAWTSFSGGGQYDSTPFSDAGILVLALEDNYPFRQKHTVEDTPDIIRPATLQQMGDQALAILQELGSLDLTNPWDDQETFFAIPYLGLAHYPQSWSLPFALVGTVPKHWGQSLLFIEQFIKTTAKLLNEPADYEIIPV